MEGNQSYLSHINPSVKLIAHLAVMFLLMMISEPGKTLLIWTAFLFLGMIGGGWTIKYLLKVMPPYFVFFVLTFWMLAAFGKGETEIWQWAWFRITAESASNGLTIATRMLAFVTIGLLFTSTTCIHPFMMSLVHQLKVPPKWAYGFMAGFRCIPLFQKELAHLKEAHRIRGCRHNGSWQTFKRYAVPLLTNAVRKSERMALAMEVRGFTGDRDRSYYKKTIVTKKDYYYASLLVGSAVFILIF
ncbi:energy-coupling factor transporter transmembrane component T [Paenibacillus alvei]|uniref:energy-coupling factor transporter transmembrane component T family protein n=1 Tax=Niallia sp. FSL R7-0271 TaxID=2921678 RepID=UPI0030F5632C